MNQRKDDYMRGYGDGFKDGRASSHSDYGEALRLYRLAAEASCGCGDGNCVVLKPVGVHTNGGCRCCEDRMKAQRMMRAGQRLYEAIVPSPTASPIPR